MKFWPLPGFEKAPNYIEIEAVEWEGPYPTLRDMERIIYSGDIEEARLALVSLERRIEVSQLPPREGPTPQAQMMYDQLVASEQG